MTTQEHNQKLLTDHMNALYSLLKEMAENSVSASKGYNYGHVDDPSDVNMEEYEKSLKNLLNGWTK